MIFANKYIMNTVKSGEDSIFADKKKLYRESKK